MPGPSPSTPPHSENASNRSVLSKTTPLKLDLHRSQKYSSSPQQKASLRYKEMTRDACEKFVGPMPVDAFLEDFVPKASRDRPTNEITFSHSSVSQNENEFVSRHAS